MNFAATLRIAGATARMTRLIVEDDVPGAWWIKTPIDEAMGRYVKNHTRVVPVVHEPGHLHFESTSYDEDFDEPWWFKYRDGLDCAWCVSVHAAFWLTLVEELLPRTGIARRLWNIGTGALALSYVTARAEVLLDGIDS